MNYGMYLSAAGTIGSLHRQDVMANNLANVNTIGFKPDVVHAQARLPERLESESHSAFFDPQHLLEQLGGGAFVAPSTVNFRQGDLTPTNNDLDVAIQGDAFFMVAGKSANPSEFRLTRDGRFTRNAAGELTMASTGRRVLDVNSQPIRLNGTGAVRIDAEGIVHQDNQIVAQLKLVTAADKRALAKDGNNLLRLQPGHALRSGTNAATLKQGFVESSGVDAILMMNQMINASKAVQANATMMQYHDHILGQAVNTFGRVA